MDNQGTDWEGFAPLIAEPPIETVSRRTPSPEGRPNVPTGGSSEDFQGFAPLRQTGPESYTSDVARSLGAGAIKGAGDIAALPGEAVTFARWVTPHIGYLGRRAGEAVGALEPGAAQRAWEQAKKEEEQATTPEERSGKYATVLGYNLPRTSRTQEWIQENIPAANYQSQSVYGKLAEEAGRFGAGMAIPGAGTTALAGRGAGATIRAAGRGALSGAGAGVASEAAGEVAKRAVPDSPMVEAAVRLSAALVGGGLGGKAADVVGRFGAPSATAAERLGSAMSRDFREGTSTLTFEDLKKGLASGAMPIDAMGPRARKIVAEAARISPATSERAGRLAGMVAERTDAASQNVANRITSIFGEKVNPAQLSQEIAEASRPQIDALYTLSRSNPSAQSMWNNEFSRISSNDFMQKAMKQANSVASIPTNKIISPVFDASGSVTRAPNLAYWDKVKQYIDDQISAARRTGENSLVRDLTSLKKQFVGLLDRTVPDYAKARNSAAEMFGAQNSLEAGYNALRDVNLFKSQDIKNAFASMPADQQRMFATGAAGFMNELVQKNGVNSFYNLYKKPEVAERARLILGKDNFNSIMNQAQMERKLATTQVPVPGPGDIGHKWTDLLPPLPVVGGGTGFIGSAIYSGALPLAMEHFVTGGAGMIASLAAKGAYNWSEGRIAKRIMDMAGTTDPKKLAALQAELSQSPAWRGFINKTAQYGYLSDLPTRTESATEPRPQRASGGKVSENDIHEQLVGRLMSLAEKAKKTTQKSTEPLLNAPDEAIVHALKVADNVI
jgi:hypothetical protein